MKAMNNWEIAREIVEWECDDDGQSYVVYHYVGGEEPLYVYNFYKYREIAEKVAALLNSKSIKYKFDCYEGECKLIIEGL